MRFLDTNILLYSISGNPEEGSKARIAVEILDSADLALSSQVLQEFIVQATRRTRADRIEMTDALALVETWLRFPVQATTVDVVKNAVKTASRWNISYWDAAIIEAARLLGCHRVLSEDLNAILPDEYGSSSADVSDLPEYNWHEIQARAGTRGG